MQNIQAVGGVLVVETNNNGIGAYITSNTALIAPSLEEPVWVWGSFLLSRLASHLALFTQEATLRPDDDAGIDLQQVILRPHISVIPLSFPAPKRPGCGKSHGGWEAFGQPKFTQRYVYLAREDNCGRFMTRYDWVTPQAPPLSYPVKN